MRIAYVTETYPPELNGVSLTVERTVRFLRARGHLVELIRPRQPGEAALDAGDELRTAGCALPMYPEMRFGLASAGRLARRFAATRPDLVHLATPGPLARSALAAAERLGLPLTSDFRTNFHEYARFYGIGWLAAPGLAFLRRFHNRTGRTFVPTRAAAAELGRAGFQNLCVVGRGVDCERFTPSVRSEAMRAGWGAAPGDPVLLAVGRVAAEKNIELALRAFEQARREQPRLRMVVVGDGPARPRFEAAHPSVRFLGARRDAELAACYASADAFAFPSLTDTFGNVVLEALASGLPVISFNVAAAAEHVVDGQSGSLVKAGDEAAYIAAVSDTVRRVGAGHSFGEAALVAARRATWPEVLQRFEANLEDTVHAAETTHPRIAVVA